MAVFRIDKTRDYTVMANFHLRDTSLSLKAKGLLCLMLSFLCRFLPLLDPLLYFQLYISAAFLSISASTPIQAIYLVCQECIIRSPFFPRA